MQRLIRAAQARNLDRIAATYAVAGWILVQGAAIVFPVFDAPSWALRSFILAVVAGFPVALTIAWFAATPIDAIHSAPIDFSHREIVLLALLGAVVLLSLGELAFVVGRPARAPVSAQDAPMAASIAVLPFVNMSGDPAREVISDGISEELLNDLANIPALRVAARTSSFAFKGKNEDIREIARLLEVRAVLEGSIREDGQHIRITAQLINALDGYHLWSATFDRDMTSILTLEDEIARAITSALTNKLLGAPGTASAGKPASIDPQAYRKYLEGLHELGPRTKDGNTRAVALLEQVTALQPDFADGFAALGRALINHAEDFPEQKELMPAAEAALARALEIDPNNMGALASHLDLALHKLDWPAAASDAARMRAINPNSVAVLHEMFRYYQLLGFPDKALEAARGAARLDPLSVVDRLNVASALIHIARFGEAVDAALAALRLQSDQPYVKAQLCTAYAHSGHLAEAHAIDAGFARAHDSSNEAGCAFDIAAGEGRIADARKIMDGLAARYPNIDFGPADLGDSYAMIGDSRSAVTWLARAYDERDFTLFAIPFDRAIPASVRADPGWRALLARPLFKDWRAAHDRLAAVFAGSR